MISNAMEESNFGSGRLLDDLVEYVYNGRNNRLVLIGDEAQLPPVGLEMSPALEPQALRMMYNLEVYEAHLTDVMRQAEESGDSVQCDFGPAADWNREGGFEIACREFS